MREINICDILMQIAEKQLNVYNDNSNRYANQYTFTSHSSIFRMVTVVLTNGVSVTLQ